MEVEIWMLEEFELNENMKATEEIVKDIIMKYFQLYWKKVREKLRFPSHKYTLGYTRWRTWTRTSMKHM